MQNRPARKWEWSSKEREEADTPQGVRHSFVIVSTVGAKIRPCEQPTISAPAIIVPVSALALCTPHFHPTVNTATPAICSCQRGPPATRRHQPVLLMITRPSDPEYPVRTQMAIEYVMSPYSDTKHLSVYYPQQFHRILPEEWASPSFPKANGIPAVL